MSCVFLLLRISCRTFAVFCCFAYFFFIYRSLLLGWWTVVLGALRSEVAKHQPAVVESSLAVMGNLASSSAPNQTQLGELGACEGKRMLKYASIWGV